MGNCQAIDSATLVIQHPNGKVDNFYWPIAASEIMKMNPGHYVALLLTTTLYSSPAAAPAAAVATATTTTATKNIPLRITRIKLLRPTDTLVLGHVYRLVTHQEVMKGLSAKKQAKMKQQQPEKNGKIVTEKLSSDFEAVVRKEQTNKLVKHESRQSRSRNNTQINSGVPKSRAWQPSLNSISEAGS
ncbi:hypothetical protein CDL12_30437 [Handroanthus impetiginosus]|uniref:DUF4228 domain-containing protein n=1 Tax=Handroanthus impetiginosus TaxID=429701 RepID=A0A2G9FVI4_9LAMI|nr:hypothetical protein CDL12_30437 [Handroanthus impetiginosus]